MKGKIYVTGIGPGNSDMMCGRALQVIKKSTLIVGYKKYIALIESLIEEKEVFSNGMRGEKIRCEKALEYAEKGETVALVSSGDPGIYGMAGLMLEIAEQKKSSVEIEVVPGISAFNAAAALLGAPLMHDFAVISLSDLLTDWKVIEKRLEAASSADFVIALYNPRSKSRVKQLDGALEIMLSFKNPATPVGIVKNAFRKNQEKYITTLEKINEFTIDMYTLIVIGNSQTYVRGEKIITPRGYKL